MEKLINKILFCTKIIFLIIAFVVTLYILLVRMDVNELSITSVLFIFVPLFLVLAVFVFSFFLNIGNDNIIFNLTCVMVLLSIIFIDYRTVFDHNIISNTAINLNFFEIQTNRIQIMLYLMFISNILLIIYDKKNKIHS